jgi:hypothetical protein
LKRRDKGIFPSFSQESRKREDGKV